MVLNSFSFCLSVKLLISPSYLNEILAGYSNLGCKFQRINPRRRYNNYKYICTQHRSTPICKANADKNERGNSNTVIVGDFNTPLTPTDRSTKQKISKETQTLKDTMDRLDLIDIYRAFHPKTINFTFLSSAHGTFSRIDHILGHKSSHGKFKKLKSSQASFLITMQ